MISKMRVCFVVLSVCAMLNFSKAIVISPTVAPTIISLSPPSAYVNSPSFTLTVTGTNFVSGAAIYFGYNSPLTTTFISSTKLTAPVPASFLTSEYNYSVFVANPGNLDSNSLNFAVVGLDPSLNSLSPSSAMAGTSPGPISVNGQNFMGGASILLNGMPVSTTYVSSTQLQFTPTKAQLSTARIAQISVANPPPGGLSSTLNFDVTYRAKVTALNLPANDLVWDPYAQRIYASMPSSFGANGNSIAVINPSTGKVLKYYFAGSEPNQMALSSDSKYLYVGLNGNYSVQRLILPSFTHDIDIPLTGDGQGGSTIALSIAVDPADDHTFAVAEASSGCCGSYGLYFYKDSTELSNSITYPSISDAVFASGTVLYGYSNSTVSEISVSAAGGTLDQQWNGLVTGTTIQYAGGLIYGNGGEVLDPATGLLVGTYDVGVNCCYNTTVQLFADPAIDRTFAIGNTPFFTPLGITTYDLNKFTPIAVADLSQFTYSAASPTFLHWGNSGLAFVLTSTCCGNNAPPQVILVQSPAMFASGTDNPVPIALSLSPGSAAHGSGNLLVNVKGSNFVAASRVTWNGASLFADYVSPTQLNLYVPAASLSVPGTANVVVTNPATGGGTSSPLTFTIN